jgi:hypothetical protein
LGIILSFHRKRFAFVDVCSWSRVEALDQLVYLPCPPWIHGSPNAPSLVLKSPWPSLNGQTVALVLPSQGRRFRLIKKLVISWNSEWRIRSLGLVLEQNAGVFRATRLRWEAIRDIWQPPVLG